MVWKACLPVGIFGTLFADVCGIGALVAALHDGVTPPALMVGYAATALAALVTAGALISG